MNFIRQIEVYIEGLSDIIRHKGISEKGKSYQHITFSGEFSEEEEPNTMQLSIYNLSTKTINAIEINKKITINAGYEGDEGDVGNVMAGVIYKLDSKKEGSDVATKIYVQDATENWLKGSISKTFQGSVKASYVIKQVLGSLGMAIGRINLANDVIYQTGKTVSGSLASVIKQLANECGSRININSGKIDILIGDEGFETGYILGSKTGLIGMPQVVEEYINEDDDITRADYRIKMLLNHHVRPRSIFKIESLSETGLFFAIKGKYNEDFTMDVDIKAL